MDHQAPRRDFLKTAAVGLTTSLLTGNVRGANDRVSVAVIGTGTMGQGNLKAAMKTENVAIAAVCDIYEPNLKKASAIAGDGVRAVKDFREIIADKSIDAVCIATPDHWHAYMTVEACKAGKDVYVEKPVSVTIEEGALMVKAARKYNRVVQAGTMQRSAMVFKQACEYVKSGKLGKLTFVRTWNGGSTSPEGFGNPPDAQPFEGLDWDMWLGPAPKRAFNENRFGVLPGRWSTFRYFWDYAGGAMTDWGVHLMDITQMGTGETMPLSVTALGGRFIVKDNLETPDTMQVTYEYPGGFLAVYENGVRDMTIHGEGYGTLFQGTEGSLLVNRGLYKVIPGGRKSALVAEEVKSTGPGNAEHWQNFIECIKTRQRPASDIELCHKSSAVCHLGNIAYRSKLRVDWDNEKQTIVQPEARKYMSREYRKPWKLVV